MSVSVFFLAIHATPMPLYTILHTCRRNILLVFSSFLFLLHPLFPPHHFLVSFFCTDLGLQVGHINMSSCSNLHPPSHHITSITPDRQTENDARASITTSAQPFHLLACTHPQAQPERSRLDPRVFHPHPRFCPGPNFWGGGLWDLSIFAPYVLFLFCHLSFTIIITTSTTSTYTSWSVS